MVGSIRSLRVALTSLALVIGPGLIGPPRGIGQEQPARPTNAAREQAGAGNTDSGGNATSSAKASIAKAPANNPKSGTKLAHDELDRFFKQAGEDPPPPFAPLRPMTVDDRRRVEAVRLYAAARGLEDRRDWEGAVALLQDALKLDPDSVAIARRLGRIYVGALGRPDLALQYGKKVLAADPGDTDTLARLVDYYNKNDAPAGVALLEQVLANPKLDAHAPGRLLAQFELGRLYSGRLRDAAKAADAFAKVIQMLDDKSSNRLTAADQARILGDDPAAAYLNFGLIFLAARRNELAVKAFERGLVYDEDNPQISLLLAETLLALNKGDQALQLVERSIKRQPQGVEAYELLAKVLKALKREAEITPRLEEAARRDSKNVPLQYILADRYRETGQADKADALYKALLTSQPTPRTYAALSKSLYDRKKAGDLLRVISEAMKRQGSPEYEAVMPQLQKAVFNDEIALAMLEAGLTQLASDSNVLPKTAYGILKLIANNPPSAPNRVRRLETLVKIHQLMLKQNPSALNYSELADTLHRLGKNVEAADAVERMLAEFPNEKNARTLVLLGDFQRRAGRNDAVKKTLREVMKLDHGDGDTQRLLANLLSDLGEVDDAVKVLREAAKRDPGDPRSDLMLADVLRKFGRDDDAIKLLDDMLKRYGDNEEVVKMLHSLLSIIYVNQGNYTKGEAELEVLLQRNPDEPGPNNDLGYLYAEQGKNLVKAEAMIRKALQEEPDKYAYLDSLGWVLFKQGKLKEALAEMKKAADRMKIDIERDAASPDTTVYEHLGDIYFQLQELDKAAESWRQAIDIGQKAIPPEKRVAEIRKKLESLEKLGAIPKASTNRTP
jgi:tetratricopeptide (TPR) repeat protein